MKAALSVQGILIWFYLRCKNGQMKAVLCSQSSHRSPKNIYANTKHRSSLNVVSLKLSNYYHYHLQNYENITNQLLELFWNTLGGRRNFVIVLWWEYDFYELQFPKMFKKTFKGKIIYKKVILLCRIPKRVYCQYCQVLVSLSVLSKRENRKIKDDILFWKYFILF